MTQQHRRPIGVVWPGQKAVELKELELLRRKAAAHDRFVEALREMGRRQSIWVERAKKGDEFAKGWLRSLREIADLVVKGVSN